MIHIWNIEPYFVTKMKENIFRVTSLSSGSEFKENYSYWTKIFSDIISLLGTSSEPGKVCWAGP